MDMEIVMIAAPLLSSLTSRKVVKVDRIDLIGFVRTHTGHDSSPGKDKLVIYRPEKQKKL